MHSKLSAKFRLGTSTVTKKVGLLSHFLFLARATIRIYLSSFVCLILFITFSESQVISKSCD